MLQSILKIRGGVTDNATITNNLHLYHGSYCEVQIPDLK